MPRPTFSLRTLLIAMTIMGGYCAALHYAWQPQEAITVTKHLSDLDRQTPVAVLGYSVGHPYKANWLGFPQQRLWGWQLLKVELFATDAEAKLRAWLATPAGQRKLTEAWAYHRRDGHEALKHRPALGFPPDDL